MYFQQDTILRLIEMLGAAFRALMQMQNDMEAEQALDDAYLRFCGISRALSDTLSIDDLAQMLTPDRRVALSELMWMQTQRFSHKLDTDEIQQLLLRALRILCSVDVQEIATLRLPRAKELVNQCQSALAPDHLPDILRFYTLGGAYAEGEDLLFYLLSQYPLPNHQTELIQTGLTFYHQLLSLPDETLNAGHLPRAEVNEALGQLDHLSLRAQQGE